MLGNIERLEVVVRSFHLRPGDHRVAERKKNPLDLLEGLPQRMPRAKRANHARKREVFAFARQRRLSAAASIAARRDSSAASTCALSALSACPTARFSSGFAGLSQFSVMRVSTPDLRPSQAPRSSSHCAAFCFASSSARIDFAHRRTGEPLPRRRRRPVQRASSLSGRSSWDPSGWLRFRFCAQRCFGLFGELRNPAASFTAMSASILRSISTPAALSPCINWL